MNNNDINEVLLLVVKTLRSQAETLDDFGSTLHAVHDLLTANQAVAKRIEELEAESKAATSLPKQHTLRKFDDIIRKLESARPPEWRAN